MPKQSSFSSILFRFVWPISNVLDTIQEVTATVFSKAHDQPHCIDLKLFYTLAIERPMISFMLSSFHGDCEKLQN